MELGLGESPGCTTPPQNSEAGLHHRGAGQDPVPKVICQCHPRLSCHFSLFSKKPEGREATGRGETKRKGTSGVATSTFMSPTGCQEHL